MTHLHLDDLPLQLRLDICKSIILCLKGVQAGLELVDFLLLQAIRGFEAFREVLIDTQVCCTQSGRDASFRALMSAMP